VNVRPTPADTDLFEYDIDKIRLGGTDVTLRQILGYACDLGKDPGIHADEDMAEHYAEVCQEFVPALLPPAPNSIRMTVAEARELHEACLSALEYAITNNYDDPTEPDEEARTFGQNGRFMLGALALPWTWLHEEADGSFYFKLVTD
jgi:hypothetical protein